MTIGKELEMTSSQGRGRGVLVLLFPLQIRSYSLDPEITSKLVPSFLVPKMVCVPLFPRIFCLLFPVPQFKLAIFPCFPKPVGGPQGLYNPWELSRT